MYNVNASIPKRWSGSLCGYAADHLFGGNLRKSCIVLPTRRFHLNYCHRLLMAPSSRIPSWKLAIMSCMTSSSFTLSGTDSVKKKFFTSPATLLSVNRIPLMIPPRSIPFSRGSSQISSNATVCRMGQKSDQSAFLHAVTGGCPAMLMWMRFEMSRKTRPFGRIRQPISSNSAESRIY